MSDGGVHIDRALARRILRGDARAFQDLFDRFYPRLYRFALARLGGDEEAAVEIVQITFCKGLERLASYRGEAALYTWFCQICRNSIFDHYRATGRSAARMTLLEDSQSAKAILETLTAPVTGEPETAAWQDDVRHLVQTTVDALPDHYGDILEWKYLEGISVRDISTRLGMGEKAAESLLARARSAFRELILELAATTDLLEPPRRN